MPKLAMTVVLVTAIGCGKETAPDQARAISNLERAIELSKQETAAATAKVDQLEKRLGELATVTAGIAAAMGKPGWFCGEFLCLRSEDKCNSIGRGRPAGGCKAQRIAFCIDANKPPAKPDHPRSCSPTLQMCSLSVVQEDGREEVPGPRDIERCFGVE